MAGARNVLVVEVPQAVFESIAPVLRRTSFEVDCFQDAGRALGLLAVVPFTAIIIGFPLRRVSIESFLEAVRKGQSAAASVALLASGVHRAAAEALLGHGVGLVLDREKAPQETVRLLCSLLGVSRRSGTRVMVKVQLLLESHLPGERIMAQTRDVSSSGMFVTTGRRFPLGSTVHFEMQLPDGGAQVTGEAEVARHTDVGTDRREGMGFRFSSVDGEGQTRLQRYLDGLQAGT